MSEQFKLESIPPHNIINVQISGAFYGRLQQLLLHYAQQKSPEQLREILNTMDMANPKDDFEYHYATILTMVLDVERLAKEQGKTKIVDFTPPANS